MMFWIKTNYGIKKCSDAVIVQSEVNTITMSDWVSCNKALNYFLQVLLSLWVREQLSIIPTSMKQSNPVQFTSRVSGVTLGELTSSPTSSQASYLRFSSLAKISYSDRTICSCQVVIKVGADKFSKLQNTRTVVLKVNELIRI